ncbi:autotransporter domain-containing protein [Pandoraea vervacti]|uniref:autotransporter domain-containing protein n=1 Tax=Pandoraea vervacti TaxID=656178 RepID=UPI003AAFB768
MDVVVTSPSGSSAPNAGDRYTYVAKPTAVTISMTIAFNSPATPVNVDLSNGVTSVAVDAQASNGTATAAGTSLTYQPNAGFSGTDSFKYTLTNAGGTSAAGTVTVTVSAPALTYAPTAPAAGAVGVTYTSDSLKTASGGTGPYAYSVVGTLPPGLTLDPSGRLYGTPTTVGNYSFQVTAKDYLSAGGPYTVTSGTISMAVTPPSITFNPSSLPDGVAGVGYAQTIQASGGGGQYTYTLTTGTLPAGITWNPATGVISGTPTQTNTGAAFTIMATDRNNFSATLSLTLRIAPPVLDLNPTTLPAAVLGQAYSQVVTGIGGNGPYTFAVTGLPNGLSFVSGPAGVTISGTPTAAGAFPVTVKITDSTSGPGAPFSVNKSITLTVNTSTMTLSPTTLPTPVAGQAYNQTLTAANGVAPYRYNVTTGTLPNGLTLDPATGIVSGTPTTTGNSTFTVTATDSSTGPGTPLTATQTYNFNITGQVASAPPVQMQTLSNAPVTFRATANAAGGPFTRIAIATPPSSGTAVVNGEDIVYTPTPSTNGDVTFAYTLTNAIGTSAPISVTVTVHAVPVTVASLESSVAANGTADLDITSGATGGPFTGANVVSISPANAGTVTIVSTPATVAPAAAGTARFARAAAVPTGNNYTLRFVPAAAFAGVAVITYTISNANATSAPGTARVTVAPRKDPTTDPDVTGLIGAQVEAARRFATTQIGNYNQRLEMLHGKGRAPSSNGLNVVLPSADRGANRDLSRCQDIAGIADRDACLRGEASPTALRQAKRLDVRDKSDKHAGASGVATGDGPDLPGEGENGDQRFAYWTAGTVDFGFANTAAQRSGFKFTTGGVTMGADYRFSDQFSLGAGVGYGHDSTDIGSSGTRSTGDSYSGALYASYRPIPTLFVDAVAGFGTLSFDSRRWVVDANDFAQGKRNGQQFFGSLSAGYEYRTDDWLFSPYGRLTASRSTLDQYSETGAGLNALTYFKQNVNTLSGTLGVRAGFAKATAIGTFSPYIRVELQHDFNGQSLAGLAYADIAQSGPVYFVPGSPYGSDRVQVGAGTKLRTGVLVFGLDYSVTTGMGGLQQGFRLTFTAPF